jgi:hypothetical protein
MSNEMKLTAPPGEAEMARRRWRRRRRQRWLRD